MPPPPAWFGPAPCPVAPMVPVHAAPSRTAKASPARPRARCCAARVPTSRREHDDGSLVQLTSLFLSKVRAVFNSRSSRHQRAGVNAAGWSAVVLGRNRRKGHWADRRLFVKRTHLLLRTEQRGQGEGDFLTRSEGEMQMADGGGARSRFRRYRELHAEHPDRAPAPAPASRRRHGAAHDPTSR